MSMRKSVVGVFLIFALFLFFGGAALQECEASQAAGTCPVYRFYNTQTGTHFFTISEAEKDHVIATYPQFTFEGIAWYAHPVGDGCGIPPNGSAKWGVLTNVYCADDSFLTFSTEIDGTTKSSTGHGQNSTPSWEGYASTTAGSKSALWSVSSGCGGSDSGSTTSTLEAGKCYLFLLDLDDSGLVIRYGETDCGDPRQSLSSSSSEENGDAMHLEELGGITLYSDFFDGKLETIEEYKIDLMTP